jgi:hypothetical protein
MEWHTIRRVTKFQESIDGKLLGHRFLQQIFFLIERRFFFFLLGFFQCDPVSADPYWPSVNLDNIFQFPPIRFNYLARTNFMRKGWTESFQMQDAVRYFSLQRGIPQLVQLTGEPLTRVIHMQKRWLAHECFARLFKEREDHEHCVKGHQIASHCSTAPTPFATNNLNAPTIDTT